MSAWNNVLIVGGGAAGMYAAIAAAGRGAHVTILEKNDRLGKKLYITGKGRCNVTNNCSAEEVRKNVPTNARFLFSALSACQPQDVMAFFEQNGCALKTERGNRVFPVSDRSASVIDCFKKRLHELRVRVVQDTAKELLLRGGVFYAVRGEKAEYPADCVIVATGGCSYPLTGSTGDGYALARAIGHTLIEPEGSLVPLVERGHDCAQMQGLSLRNVSLKLKNAKGKTVFEDFGELLFTHFGLSGPLVLSASAHMARGEEGYVAEIDLKPALDEQTLDARIVRDFEKNQNRDFANSLSELLPRSIIPVVVRRSGVDPAQKVNAVTRQQRRQLLEIIKHFTVPIACKAPVEEAIVTTGGVKVSEVDPKTMQSKKAAGVFFAGEILDVDAYTGGFNLQIAWATGFAAGCAAAEYEKTATGGNV